MIALLLMALIHAPVFYFAKWLTDVLVKEEGHADSKLIGFLFICYPLLLLALTITVVLLTGNALWLLLLVASPFAAWSYVQLKNQLDKTYPK